VYTTIEQEVQLMAQLITEDFIRISTSLKGKSSPNIRQGEEVDFVGFQIFQSSMPASLNGSKREIARYI
jgi:hypothetical protein